MKKAISGFNRTEGNFLPGFKLLVIIGLGLLMLIPMGMIRGLVDERRGRSIMVSDEVRKMWGGYQTLTGPFLEIPYLYRYHDDEGIERTATDTAYFLPEELEVTGKLLPEIRTRGIYEVPLFLAELKLAGSFSIPDGEALGIAAGDFLFDRARLYLSVSDPRGIRNAAELVWGRGKRELEPGTDPFSNSSGAVWAEVPVSDTESEEGLISFSLDLDLACGGVLSMVPVGRRTVTVLTSSWSSPSYLGSYLPTSHNYDDEGFTARWEVNALGRSFPMSWTGRQPSEREISGSSFGVKFFDPVDIYARNERAVKYGFLFILIPFLVFMMAELVAEMRIHPLQYLLAVSANLIFFLLLLSLSEHLPFTAAFFIAASGSATELFLYSRYSMSRPRIGTVMLLAAGGLYGFLFTALQSEDYALLIGSLGLFLLLGLVMLMTRSIRWYNSV